MKKIITLFIILAMFTVSCGKKVKVDESKCLTPEGLNEMLKEYYSHAGGPYGNTDSFDENYERFLQIHATIGCEINKGNIKEKFEGFEESRRASGKQNLILTDKATYPLDILKTYRLNLTYKTFEEQRKHIDEYAQMQKELENLDPNKLEQETVKTYNEISKLISKENLKNSDVSLVGPNVNVAHILQGDYEWSY
mgnify:FL=1